MSCTTNIINWTPAAVGPGAYTYCLHTAVAGNYYGISIGESDLGIELTNTGYYVGSFSGPCCTITNNSGAVCQFTIRIVEVVPEGETACNPNLSETSGSEPPV